MGRLLEFITDFGDSAVTLPLAVAIFAYLIWGRWYRAALRWGLAVGGCGLAMALLKLGLLACGAPPLLATLRSPSGHAAMAAVVYGGLAGLVASRCRREWLALPYAAAQLLIMAIALSRIALLAHSPLEVMVGLGVGTVFATLFTLGLGEAPPTLPPFRWLLGVAAAVLLISHGLRLQIEEPLRALAPGFWMACP